MTNIWTIVPYRSFGKISFGESESSALEELGQPDDVEKNEDAEMLFWYNDGVLVSTREKVIHEINVRKTDEGVRPEIDGINIFEDDPKVVLSHLEKLNETPVYEEVGFLIFDRLGTMITGLHDGDESQLAVSTFDKESYRAPEKPAKRVTFFE